MCDFCEKIATHEYTENILLNTGTPVKLIFNVCCEHFTKTFKPLTLYWKGCGH